MSLTFSNKTTDLTTPTITTRTFSFTNSGGARNWMFLLVITDLSANYTGVTYNGVSMTQVDTRTTTTTTERWAWYALQNPANGTNNVVITFNTAPYNPVSVFCWSASDCGEYGNVVFDDTASSPNSTSITVSSNSMVVGAAVAGANTGKDITIDGSSRTIEFTHNVYNFHYAAISASGLTSGSKTVSVSNGADVAGYYLEIKELLGSNAAGAAFLAFV